MSAETIPGGVFGVWKIKQHHPPFSVPRSAPKKFGIAASLNVKQARLGESKRATRTRSVAAFDQLLPFEPSQLEAQPVPVGPNLEGIRQITKRRAHEHIAVPTQQIEKLFSLCFHRGKSCVQLNMRTHPKMNTSASPELDWFHDFLALSNVGGDPTTTRKFFAPTAGWRIA